MSPPDYYGLLGVAATARFADLKKAYYRRAMECHPDRFAGHPQKAEAFKRLVEAFNVLSDPLSRAAYDARRRPSVVSHAYAEQADYWEQEAAVLDTRADDILEEMIVGNTIPRHTTLQTLMLDLERTNRFCLFREGKTRFYTGETTAAQTIFASYLIDAPLNILAHYYLGRCHLRLGHYRRAARAYATAIRIGSRRKPPLLIPRIRGELRRIQSTKLGWFSRAKAWWLTDSIRPEPVPPDVEIRRDVSRAMHNLIREQARNERKKLRA